MFADRPLRILHLDDDTDYCTSVRDLLIAAGWTVEVVVVTDRVGFEAALARSGFDVILGDFSLPGYSGLQALATARELAPQTSFLLLSGTIGEEAAIRSLRAGATDYVLKQWPDRLVPGIKRAVEEAREKARRQEAETELIRKERYVHALTNHAREGVSLLDEAGRFVYNSPTLQRMLGYGAQSFSGESVLDFIHPDDRPRAEQAFDVCVANPEQPMLLELRLRHQNGSWVHLEAVGQNRLNDPEIKAVVFNLRDATERRRQELRQQALYNLGRNLSSVRGPHEAAVVIRDIADQLFAWDVFTLDLLGDDPDETRPILNMDTIAGGRVVVETPGGAHETSPLARRIMQKGAERILVAEPVRMLPDSRPFGDTSRPSASLLFAPIRNRKRVLGLLSVQSYTANAYSEGDLETLQVLADHCGGALERIGADEELRASEARFREIFVNSPDAIFVENFVGTVLDVNPAGCRLHGLTRAQLLGRNVAELVPEEQRTEMPREFKRLLDGEVSSIEGESLAADGRVTPVEIRVTRIEYNSQPALLLHVRDISERKKTEFALRSSEMLFHSVWENSVDGMRLTDETGRIFAVNQAYCRLVGLSRSEIEGRFFTVIYADSEQPERLLWEYQRRFRERAFEPKTERRLTLRSGKSVVLEDANSFVERRGQPPLLLGLFRDVTLQRGLEEQLRQSQKMDAIGHLAGGVAHDFNNILTVIQGHGSLLVDRGRLDDRDGNSARQIVQAAERAASLTRQLLAFGRRQVMQPRPLDLNEIVTNMSKMLGRILGEDIALQTNYWPEPPRITGDSGMMEQVLLNLAVNARDAMPAGGRLSLRIAVVEMPVPLGSEPGQARAGRFVCLTVSDTGCGIAPENLDRIFEPFFTTKEIGKGTGLGLATVYGIVKQHGGWIEVESQVGQGATFRVYLPETPGATKPAEAAPAKIHMRGGTETILVVEDEQPVRELACGLLQAQGYRILAAESGVRALEVWRTHRSEIALLLTDLVMPDCLSGRELVEQIWAEAPALKVIFTSGYSADVAGEDWILQRGLNYLQKPYRPRQLVQAVRDCLDASELTPVV